MTRLELEFELELRYRHAIWDFDGTIFDAYPIMAETFRTALLREGVDVPAGGIDAHMRVSMGHACEYYGALYQLDEAFFHGYEELRREAEEHELRPFAGVEAICRNVYGAGGRNYLYTHRGSSAGYFLKKFRMDVYFADAITGEDDFPRKPHPAALLHLAQKHGMEPGSALMVGDRAVDVLAAKNAGMAACFVKYGGKDCPNADYNITGPEELGGVLGLM